MIKIDKHISELLYEHDCVIVPELGGFLASYSPSAIHPVQHTFSAPSKKIAFNAFLRQNDGLLASHVSQSESFTYNQALKEIEGYVDHCRQQISGGNKFIIEKVGTLHKDVEGNLQFEPFKNVNYLKNSFGLVSIQFLPIEQISANQRTPLIDRPKKNDSKSVREVFALRPSKAPIKYSWKKIRNTVLIAGAVVWFCFNVYMVVTPSQFSFSSLSPVPESAKVETPVIKVPEKTISTPPVVVSHAPEVPKEEKTVVPETTTQPVVTEKTSENNFFVIGGAFRSEENATKFSETLKAEGFNSARILNPGASLKMVCYAGFPTLADAHTELSRLKSMQKEAWIYRH